MCLANKKSIFTAGSILLGLLLGSQTGQASECKVIKTTLDGASFLCGDSPVGLCADGVISSGILKGTKTAVYTAAAPSAGLWTEGPSVLSYTADAVFTTNDGELYLSQLGVLDTLRQVFTELNRVVGGTGRFDQASGDLFISGTVNSSNIATEFESDVTGTVCLNISNDEDDDSDDDD